MVTAAGPEHRRARRSKRPPHPTAELLLTTTVELLESAHMDELSIAMVLERCGVSHGSLYHHFDDFHDLVEQAMVKRFERGLVDSMEGVRTLLDSTDADDFRQNAERLIVMLNDPGRRPFRLARVEILGAMQSRPRLAEKVSQAQTRVALEQADLFAECQRRGWLRGDLDPYAMSMFAIAMYLGRSADDAVDQPVDPDLWNQVALEAFRAVLFPVR